ncbi:hypothetical protein ACJJTC_019172 [Scirpophaga incertulas]
MSFDCEVRVTEGLLKGKKVKTFGDTDYFSFEGIPYAKPPIGELRFRNPEPPASWSGIKQCIKPGNRCAQINPFSSKGFEGSEDCLYLNIYTPSCLDENPAKLPVLMFIHGGRLLVGYGDYYRPDYFMKHNVVLVTINYRLNILGFLSLDIPEVPGNAGMKDCAMALKWVNRNIINFNGDPNNITVFGESAGAALSSSFLTSNMTKGLFHKVICQSGNHAADVFYHKQDHIAAASLVAAYLGRNIKNKRELCDFFKSLTVEELVGAYTMAELEKPAYVISPVLMPVVEKEFEGIEMFLAEEPKESFRNNRFAKVPMISGANMFEGAAFLRKDFDGNIMYEKNFKYFVPQALQLKDDDPQSEKLARHLKHYYFQNKKVDNTTKQDFVRFITDALLMREIVFFAEEISKCNPQFYAYNFHYVGNLNVRTMKEFGLEGTTHGDSVQYQFYNKSKAQNCTERDQRIIDFFCEAWCNFARYGAPSWHSQNVEWLPYTPTEKLILLINDVKQLVRNEDFDNYMFWKHICDGSAKL